ncbi:MAG: type II secretion system protein [Zetaproteobacteria bacterium]|nr:MAG: type II secretion system protein [Zetaproteobacteria bacterium]
MSASLDRPRGFSMIEMVGVLAVISILAAVIAPSAIQMISSSKQTAEDQALSAIADAFRLYVQNNKKIPNEATWAGDLATLMNSAPSKVTTNGNNGSRIYLYPQDFFTQGNTTAPLPYDQYAAAVSDANAGAISALPTSSPYNARVMVVSNLNPATPLTQTSGALAASTFDNIWNQSGAFPAELTEGDMLKIARINLADLFDSLVLNNNDPAASASYRIDGVAMPAIAPGSQVTLALIKTTQLDLLDSYGTVYNRHVLNAATSFSYLTTWGGTLGATGGSGSGGSSGSSGSTTGPNGGSTTITTLSSSNVTNPTPMATQQPNCTSQGSFTLTLTNNSNQDYLIFEGQTSGSNFVPSTPDKVKKGNTAAPTIAGCSVVLLSTGKKTAPLYLFYMPNNNTSYTFP